MNALLNLVSSAAAYGDNTVSANPKRRFFDWSRNFQGIAVTNPRSEQFTVDPSATLNAFNGTRATSIDGTTTFNVTQSALDPSIYRFTAVSGTLPAFRIDRGITLSGQTIGFGVNTNGSVTISAPSASSTVFNSVVVGDTLLIPGLVTGETVSPFDPMNTGYWTVLSVATRQLTVTRATGQVFSGATQTGLVASNGQFQVFSGTGVQPNDKVELSAGFSLSSLRNYTIVNVAPTFFEVVSTIPLAIESGIIPGVSGLQVYKFSKRFLRVETDQEAAVQFNGDTGQLCRLSPLIPEDSEQASWIEKLGATWSLSVVNRSVSPMAVSIFSAE